MPDKSAVFIASLLRSAMNAVTADTFSVLIIPHTLSVTTLGSAKAGDRMNLEIDLMARYAARLMETK